ncbi:MAG: histidinol-phosphate transaminase [Saprospiraceae bacterium]
MSIAKVKTMNNNPLFKSFISNPGPAYKGGKSRSEIVSNKKIFKLSSNENLLGSSPLALEAISNHMTILNEYPDRTGGSLQNALTKFYKGELSDDNFITANSGVGVIELIIHAFLGEGLECIVTNPTFVAYLEFCKKVGATIKDVPLIGDNFELDVDAVLSAITPNTRVIWLCSPNNPTGTHISKDKIDKIVDNIPDHVVLVYDEVYYHFVTADDYTLAMPYVQAGKNVIGINSFSKAYGLAGLRIGYAYTTKELATYINQLRRPFFINTLALEAAKAALDDTEFINKTVDNVNQGKAYLYPELDRLGVKYWKSQSNFILIKPTLNDKDFESKMLTEGIMVRRAAGFGAIGCVRVTIGDMEANLAYIKALEVVIGR